MFLLAKGLSRFPKFLKSLRDRISRDLFTSREMHRSLRPMFSLLKKLLIILIGIRGTKTNSLIIHRYGACIESGIDSTFRCRSAQPGAFFAEDSLSLAYSFHLLKQTTNHEIHSDHFLIVYVCVR